MKYLIAGLGNIGAEYAQTRHNIGFMILDALASASNIHFQADRYADRAELRFAGRTLVLIKPTTYMNLSGKAVRYWLNQEKLTPEQLLVITDDIALPVGKIRIRQKGSDGGQNGLKNITELLQTDAYPRMRFGIGNDFPKGKQVEHVLGKFSLNDSILVDERIAVAIEAIKSFATRGVENTMNQFNK